MTAQNVPAWRRSKQAAPIRFTVPLVPVAKARPRAAVIAGSARIFTPRETQNAEREFVAFAIPHAPPAPIESPVVLRLVFVLTPPKNPAWRYDAALAGAVFPRGPKDVDNLAKLVQDALNRTKRFWIDDAQVIRLEAAKVYGALPETRVEIEAVAEPQSAAEWKARPAPAPLAQDEAPLFRARPA